MKSVNNITYNKSEGAILMEHSASITTNDKLQENKLKQRLQKMEALNAHLQNLVEMDTKKLTDVMATNAKYLSILAHDLRSPFASILAVLEILKSGLNDFNMEETEKNLSMASDSARKTLNLLDCLLAWTISQSKELSFNPVKINLRKLFISEIDSIIDLARQKQIELNHSLTNGLYVTADFQMVKTILRNLISNAIKFSNPGGKITLGASERTPFVEISVQDTGIGMSDEFQQIIFKTDGFHSTIGTNNEHGAGLGLQLCKEFVELHGGNIWIESEQGKGSTFKFTLPHYI
jgi:two-component system, sensor histidine kinase and response regulator